MARPPMPSAPQGPTPLGVGAGLMVIHLAASGFCLFYGLHAAAAAPGTVSLPMAHAAHGLLRVLAVPLASVIGLGGIVRGPDLAVWAKLAANSAVWGGAATLVAWGWRRRAQGRLDPQTEGRS